MSEFAIIAVTGITIGGAMQAIRGNPPNWRRDTIGHTIAVLCAIGVGISLLLLPKSDIILRH